VSGKREELCLLSCVCLYSVCAITSLPILMMTSDSKIKSRPTIQHEGHFIIKMLDFLVKKSQVRNRNVLLKMKENMPLQQLENQK
jgi:hypothetical protein